MTEIFYVSARLIQVEVALPKAMCIDKLRNAFKEAFPMNTKLRSGQGDRGGYTIISKDEAYVKLIVDEKDESRLMGFLLSFAESEGFEFSSGGR